MFKLKKTKIVLLSGLLGCLCYGVGDWLMIYGETSHNGKLIWLTEGTAHIQQWRYILSMVLAFPGIIFYGIALFGIQDFIIYEKKKKVYHYLSVFGLTPWIAMHLIYVIILSLFAWLNNNGFEAEALTICEALFERFSWFIIAGEILMFPVFLYWFYLQIRGYTVFKREMVVTNVILIFMLLKGVSMIMPESAFRLGFTNGLMSESMIIWFILIFISKKYKKE